MLVIFSGALSVIPVAALVRQTLRSTFSPVVYMLIAWFSPLIVKFSQVVNPFTGKMVEKTAPPFGLAPGVATTSRVCGARLNCAPPTATPDPFPPIKCNPLHGSAKIAEVEGSCGWDKL